MAGPTAHATRLGRLAQFTARHRWPVIGAWIGLTLFGGFAAGQLSTRWYQSLAVPGKPAYTASQRTLEAFGVGVRAPNVVVFHTRGDATKNSAIAHAMRRAAATMPAGISVNVTGHDPLEEASSHGSGGGSSVLLEAMIGGIGALVILLFVFGTLPA